mgnify:CR=1 FL=1
MQSIRRGERLDDFRYLYRQSHDGNERPSSRFSTDAIGQRKAGAVGYRTRVCHRPFRTQFHRDRRQQAAFEEEP